MNNSVSGDDPTITQKLWQPIDRLSDAHLAAFLELQHAVLVGDEVTMKKSFDAIVEITEKQHAAHMDVLAYQVEKARRNG